MLALGHGLPAFLLLFGTTAAAVLNLGRIRSRSKLIYVGPVRRRRGRRCWTSAMNMIDNQPLGLPLLRRRRPQRPVGRGRRLPHDRPAALHRADSSAC